MRNNEHQIQTACVNWFRMQYAKELIFAIPNGGARNIVTATMMKKEGVTRGIPDLMIAAMRGQYGGLFVEMKDGKRGVVKEHQKEIIEHLRTRGYCVEVARSTDEFIDIVTKYMEQ